MRSWHWVGLVFAGLWLVGFGVWPWTRGGPQLLEMAFGELSP
jgi:hypothetical protein